MNAQTAKLYSRFAVLVNSAIVIAIFIAVTMAAAPLRFWWVVEIGLIGALYFVFFHVLAKISVGVKCHTCLKPVRSNTPWECGFCQEKNRQSDSYSFLHHCEHCGAEPKAYQCHHCGKLIFLTDDHSSKNYARCLDAPQPDPTVEEISTEQRAKRRLEHEFLMTRLNAELEAVKAKANPPKPKSIREAREESFTRHDEAHTAVHEIVHREKAANAQKYKDDQEMLKLKDASVDAWASDHT